LKIWNQPTLEDLAKIPKLYATESIPAKDKLIYEHFFIARSDWYIAEFDGRDIMFGYAILNEDFQNAEWGYVSYQELRDINVRGFQVERDMDWYAKKAGLVFKIVMSGGV